MYTLLTLTPIRQMIVRSEYIRFILLFGVIVIAFYLYQDGLAGPILFDDVHVIKDNALIKINTLDPGALVQAMESFEAGGRQISMLSFALNYYFFGASTWWFKAINLVIHSLNGVLLFWLASALVKVNQKRNSPRPTNYSFQFLPAIAVAFWIVAPINLTAVLYISQRMTLLSTFFVLVGILCYVWARLSIQQPRRKLLYMPLIIGGFTIVAYFCKENGALLPLYIFAVELFCFRFHTENQKDKVIISIFTTGALLVLFAIFYKFYKAPDWLLEGYNYRSFSLPERALTQLRALVFYISQIIIPNNSLLGLWHDDFVISTGILKPVTTLLSGIALLSLLVVALITYFRAPLIGLGIIWFFVSHTIESTIIPLEIMHEHRNYLGSFGIILALSALILRMNVQAIKHVPAIVLVSLFLWNTVTLSERSSIWSNRLTLFKHEGTAHPDSPIAVYSLGIEYMRSFLRGQEDAGELAKQNWLRVSELEPEKLHAELALIVASENGGFDYNPVWLERAIQKFPAADKHASLHSAISAFLSCLQKGVCVQSKKGASKFFDTLLESKDYQFITLYAAFYASVGKDSVKADAGFQLSLQDHDAESWTNYLFFLIKEEKTKKACDVYATFSNKLENYEFQNPGKVLHFAGSIGESLKHCNNNG